MFFNKKNNKKKWSSFLVRANHRSLNEIIAKILKEKGYSVLLEQPLDKYRSADIIGFNDEEVILIEVKPNKFDLDQSDFMELHGLSIVLTNKKRFKNKKIKKCIITSGNVSTHASHFADKLGINVIQDNKIDNMQHEIEKCILD